ncbi:hypothetical protein MKEN_00091700 [Mycena kentingensis (nom. inval.)]|nr:hypothetical protein MKEN_00091700 [Mycena kentingensis (nom. inval.)]
MAAPGVQLLDLPNELLIAIFEHIPPRSLLALPQLCRRLHYCSLPIYFSQLGMKDVSESAEAFIRQDGIDTLFALQIALFLSQIARLSIHLPAAGEGNEGNAARDLTRHVSRIASLISKLNSVRELTIVWSDDLIAVEDLNASGIAASLEIILNTALERGCSLLSMRNGQFFSIGPNTLRPSGTINAVRTATQKILPMGERGESWKDARIGRLADSTVHSLRFNLHGKRPVLTRFNIESTLLVLPPTVHWTLSAMRYSPILTLELRGLSLTTRQWIALLPLIADLVPDLSSLTLEDLHGIPGTEILLFLSKLPRLKWLQIGYTEYDHAQSSCPDSSPIPRLNHLEYLHAPSSFITHFLKKRSRMPNLKSLTVTPRKLITGYRGLRHIRQFLCDIARRLRKLKMSPEVCLEMSCGRYLDRDLRMDLVEPLGEDLAKAVCTVSRLVVYLESELITEEELETLAKWIQRFSRLSHVALRRPRHSTNTLRWATAETASALSNRISLVELELDGIVFDQIE